MSLYWQRAYLVFLYKISSLGLISSFTERVLSGHIVYRHSNIVSIQYILLSIQQLNNLMTWFSFLITKQQCRYQGQIYEYLFQMICTEIVGGDMEQFSSP